MGRVVKTMVNSQQNAGFKSVQWNATNDKGSPVSAGLYLYTIQVGEFRQTKKMVLLKWYQAPVTRGFLFVWNMSVDLILILIITNNHLNPALHGEILQNN